MPFKCQVVQRSFWWSCLEKKDSCPTGGQGNQPARMILGNSFWDEIMHKTVFATEITRYSMCFVDKLSTISASLNGLVRSESTIAPIHEVLEPWLNELLDAQRQNKRSTDMTDCESLFSLYISLSRSLFLLLFSFFLRTSRRNALLFNKD